MGHCQHPQPPLSQAEVWNPNGDTPKPVQGATEQQAQRPPKHQRGPCSERWLLRSKFTIRSHAFCGPGRAFVDQDNFGHFCRCVVTLFGGLALLPSGPHLVTQGGSTRSCGLSTASFLRSGCSWHLIGVEGLRRPPSRPPFRNACGAEMQKVPAFFRMMVQKGLRHGFQPPVGLGVVKG